MKILLFSYIIMYTIITKKRYFSELLSDIESFAFFSFFIYKYIFCPIIIVDIIVEMKIHPKP